LSVTCDRPLGLLQFWRFGLDRSHCIYIVHSVSHKKFENCKIL
jgi:hypothetical protein